MRLGRGSESMAIELAKSGLPVQPNWNLKKLLLNKVVATGIAHLHCIR